MHCFVLYVQFEASAEQIAALTKKPVKQSLPSSVTVTGKKSKRRKNTEKDVDKPSPVGHSDIVVNLHVQCTLLHVYEGLHATISVFSLACKCTIVYSLSLFRVLIYLQDPLSYFVYPSMFNF